MSGAPARRSRPGRAGCAVIGLVVLLLGSVLGPSAAHAGPGELLIRLRPPARPDGASKEAGRLVPLLESSRLIAEIGAELPDAVAATLAGAEPLLAPRRVPERFSVAAENAREPLARTFILRLQPGADPESVAAALARVAEIELVVPNRAIPVTGALRAASDPDPRRNEQWYLDRVGVAAAWAVTRGEPSVLIAIIDTGIDPHGDLAANLWRNDDAPGNASPLDDGFDQDGSGVVEDWEKNDDDDNGYVDDERGYDFVDAPRIGGPGDAVDRDPDPSDDSGHGTAVAGVIGAVADNGIGIAGLAPGCTLMPVRAGFNPGLGAFAGVLEEDDAAAAIVYAAENGARVLNMSFGDTLSSPILADAVAYARSLGAVLVSSAGNSGAPGMHYPSGLSGVIAVGASDFTERRAAFSSYGASLDLLAPGEGILTTARLGGADDYVRLSGTSFAAPLVAAAAGLLLSHAPDLTAEDVAANLLGSTTDLGAPGFDLDTGHGRLDAGRAITLSHLASVAIHSPAAGSGIDRTVPLVVTAEGLRLREFVVDVGEGREPASFRELVRASGRQVVADTVAIWDATGLPAGEYQLRLRALDAVEGWRETRTLVTVDHTAPLIQDAGVVPLWVEDRVQPFIFFATDDLARGVVDLTTEGGARRIDEAFFTRDHVLRVPEDVSPGMLTAAVGAANAAGLVSAGPELAYFLGSQRAGTHALTDTGARLPPGETAPEIADLDADGAGDLAMMLPPADPGSIFGPLAIFEQEEGAAWVERLVLPYDLLPRAVGDADGDGRMEILASAAGTSWLLESSRSGGYPDRVVWADTTASAGFAIGFAALGDPAGPALLAIRGDSLLVYRPTGDSGSWRRTAVGNFSGQPWSLAPTFFAGDVDGDGAVELVIGDAGGNVLAYRAGAGTPSGLVPAYSFALPARANPRIAGGDVTGDGRPDVAVDVGLDLEISSEALLERRRHLLLVLAAEPNTGFSVVQSIGIAGAETGGNALRMASVDEDPEAEILLVAAPDLYVFDAGEEWYPVYYQGGVRSTSLAVGDGNNDGRAEVVVRSGEETIVLAARDASIPGPVPPSGLRARIAADGAVELAWNASAERFRVYRRAGPTVDCGETPFIAEVQGSAFRDTAVSAVPEVTYRVSALAAEVEGPCSLPLTVVRSEAPGLLEVVPEQARLLRLVFSEPMGGSADRLESYLLLDRGGEAVPLSSVLSAMGGRARLLIPARDLEPGPAYRVRLGAVRSAAGAPLAGSGEIEFSVPSDVRRLPPLHLISASGAAGSGEVHLALSAPPDPIQGVDPGSYRVGGGLRVAAAAVDGSAVRLELDPATALHPGIFAVGLDPALRGVGGEVVVPGQGDQLELVIGGEIVAYPNPYSSARAAAGGVTFVGLGAGDRVILLDVLGREILRLDAANDGTAFLSVRGNSALASGIYVYRVEGAGGTRTGKLAITR